MVVTSVLVTMDTLQPQAPTGILTAEIGTLSLFSFGS